SPHTVDWLAFKRFIAHFSIIPRRRSPGISATRDEAGGWQIDPAEFHRIFPPLKIATDHPTPQQRDATTDQLVAELRAVIADLRQDRPHCRTEPADWKAQAQRLLPSPQRQATDQQPPEPASRLRRAW